LARQTSAHTPMSDLGSLQQLVFRDDLTGLLNRRYLMHRIEEEVRRSDEIRSSFAVMILDGDRFKELNDKLGHLGADRVIAAMGRVLDESTRGIDMVCRYGGDEFVILLPESGQQDAMAVARRIRERLSEVDWAAEADAEDIEVRTSIGYAVYPIHATSANELLAAADRALYSAKEAGRDRAVAASPPENGDNARPFVTCPQMVGRLEAWELIESALDTAVQGTGRTIIVSGEMGVGKTRLLRELKKSSRFNQITPVLFLTAYSHQESRRLPLHPFRDVLADVFLRYAVPDDELLRGVEPSERDEILSFVSSAAPGGRPLADRSVQLQASVRFTAAVQRLLTNVSRHVPVALFVEDVHWADHQTLDLVHYLSRSTVRERMLIILTARPDALSDNRQASNTLQRLRVEDLALQVNLERLSPEEVGAMLDLAFPTKRVSRKLKDVVFDETEGNPFYIEELLRALISENRLIGLDDGRELTLDPDVPLPRTVRDSITARLSSLNERTIQLMTMASVFGQKFELRLLASLVGLPLSTVADGLRPAQDRHLVKASASDGRESLAFLHSKIQEAFYDQLGRKEREFLHATAAQLLEKRIGTPDERSTDWDDMVAHYQRSGDARKVAFYAPQLGQRAADLFQYEDADRYFRWAVEAARATGHASIEVASLRSLADISFATGRMENAHQFCHEILDSDHLSLPDGERAAVLGLLAAVDDRLGRTDEALEAITEAQQVLQESGIGSDTLLARMRNIEGKIRVHLGELERARELHEFVLAMMEQSTHADRQWRLQQAEALHCLGVVAELTGDGPATLDRHKSAARILESIGDLPGLARVEVSLGHVYLDDGVVEEAVACFTRAIRIREQLNDVLGIAEAVCSLGRANVAIGRYSKAREHLQRALTIRTNLGDPMGQAANLADLSTLLLRQGDFEAAERHATESLALGQKLRDPGLAASARLCLAEALIAREKAEDACKLCDAAIDSLKEGGLSSRLVAALTTRAMAHVSLSQLGEAETDIEMAAEISRTSRRRRDLGRLERVRGDVASASGDIATADEHYHNALDALSAVGDPYEIGYVHLALAGLYRHRKLPEAALESAKRAQALFGRIGARAAYTESQEVVSALE
jgi:diguanylate cyclase (GGDEF)-like protein